VIHHAFGCNCPAPACERARKNQKQFDIFLCVVFFGLYLVGFYAVIRAGVFAWINR